MVRQVTSTRAPPSGTKRRWRLMPIRSRKTEVESCTRPQRSPHFSGLCGGGWHLEGRFRIADTGPGIPDYIHPRRGALLCGREAQIEIRDEVGTSVPIWTAAAWASPGLRPSTRASSSSARRGQGLQPVADCRFQLGEEHLHDLPDTRQTDPEIVVDQDVAEAGNSPPIDLRPGSLELLGEPLT